MERKNPITINEGFICDNCSENNPKAPSSCRNHCRKCLYSKHVDENTPGDRASVCNGLMEPIAIVTSGKKGQQIVHECQRCRARKLNKVADDDNKELILKLMQYPHE